MGAHTLPPEQPIVVVYWWDDTTKRLVEASTVAFVFLLLPQLWKNSQALAAGNAAALAGLSWVVRSLSDVSVLTSICNLAIVICMFAHERVTHCFLLICGLCGGRILRVG